MDLICSALRILNSQRRVIKQKGQYMGHLRGWLCMASILLGSGAVQGFVAEDNSGIERDLLRDQSSSVEERVLRPEASLSQNYPESLNSSLDNLRVSRDKKTGAIRLLWGTFEGVRTITSRDPAEYLSVARQYVDEHADIFGVKSSDLHEVTSALFMGKDEQFVKFKVYRDGTLVKDANVDFRFKRGRLLQIVTQTYAEARYNALPELSNLEARADSLVNAKRVTPQGTIYRVVEHGQGYALEKKMSFDVQSEKDRGYTMELDVSSGKIDNLQPTFFTLQGNAEADLYPRWYNESLKAMPLRLVDVQTKSGSTRTNSAGVFAADEDAAPKLDGLKGQFVTVHDMDGNNVKAEATKVDGKWHLAIKKEGNDSAWTDKRIAQNMIYDKVTEIIQYSKKYIDSPWFSKPLLANANLNDTCNAHWDGSTINFYKASSECANTGMVSDIMFHEWGHGLHHNAEGIDDRAFSEGYGDIVALMMTRSNLLGVGFLLANHAPVRDLAPVRSYPADRGEVHKEGLIIGSTFWDLYTTLKEVYGDDKAIDMISNYALKMIFTSRTYLDVYAALQVIDSDGSDPNKGTPNLCLINQVFQRHGLAEKEPQCELASIEGWELEGPHDRSKPIFKPGMSVEMRFKAKNAATKNLTDLKAIIKVQDLPGVELENTNLTWAEIESGSSKLSQEALHMRIPETATCGHVFHFNINLKSGNRQTSVVTEAMIGKNNGTMQSFAAKGMPMAIKDFQTTTASVNASASDWDADAMVHKAHLEFEIKHSYMGDLTVNLRAPDGTMIKVYKGSGRGEGTLHFNQDITEKLKSKKVSGEWQLLVKDSAESDQGSLNSFKLQLTPAQFDCR